MKVTRIDTIYWKSPEAAPWSPHWIWVRVHTDTGHIGIGETYPRNEVEVAMVHSVAARLLLGRDPRDIDRIWELDLCDSHCTSPGTLQAKPRRKELIPNLGNILLHFRFLPCILVMS